MCSAASDLLRSGEAIELLRAGFWDGKNDVAVCGLGRERYEVGPSSRELIRKLHNIGPVRNGVEGKMRVGSQVLDGINPRIWVYGGNDFQNGEVVAKNEAAGIGRESDLGADGGKINGETSAGANVCQKRVLQGKNK